jgi:hypothetical protein
VAGVVRARPCISLRSDEPYEHRIPPDAADDLSGPMPKYQLGTVVQLPDGREIDLNDLESFPDEISDEDLEDEVLEIDDETSP